MPPTDETMHCISVLSPKKRYVVAIKIGRRQDAKGASLNPYVTDKQRGGRPIFMATYLLFRGRDTSCKPEGLCFTHVERSLTPLIFYIVYVYDRATLDRATL